MKSQKSPFPTPEVLQDLETVLKIKVLESFKSELQIENDSLLAKCKSKAQRVEELTAQTVALKGELDAREADFIVYQSRNGVDAADKVRLIPLYNSMLYYFLISSFRLNCLVSSRLVSSHLILCRLIRIESFTAKLTSI